MAKKKHGSKRWIVTYDGRIKKSNDRTKKDYYADLKEWEPMEQSRMPYNRQRDKDYRIRKNFCPQCKHVQKDIVRQRDENRIAWDALRAEYNAKYKEYEKLWSEYNRKRWEYFEAIRKGNHAGAYYPLEPTVPHPPSFSEWQRKEGKHVPAFWHYDTRCYLCYKCEYKYEKQREMWRSWMPGHNDRYQWARKAQYNRYRHKVKSTLQKAKYDEKYFDNIPSKYIHGWLD
jgi:hypothetical protein